MNVRKDTSLAMSEIILAVNNIANQNQPNALGSVGHIEVSPNSRNVKKDLEVLSTFYSTSSLYQSVFR